MTIDMDLDQSEPDLAGIRAEIRRELPKAAFAPNRIQLLHAMAHIGVLLACYWAIRTYDSLWIRATCAVLAGHSHLSIGFIAHDLSHGSIIRSKRVRRFFESILWAFDLAPASMRIVMHNRTHHHYTNEKLDSFRYFMQSERTPARTLYSFFFVPNRRFPYSPFVLLNYLVQSNLMVGRALFGRGDGSGLHGLVTNAGSYTWVDRARLLFELVLVGALQVGVFFLAGGTLANYIWAGPAAFLVAASIASLYLWTQHSLYPLVERQNPLQSTSVRVPWILDLLHSFHGHHAAHHLFPSMSSRYYPAVTEILLRKYPNEADVMGLFECWRRIIENDLYKQDPGPTLPASAS